MTRSSKRDPQATSRSALLHRPVRGLGAVHAGQAQAQRVRVGEDALGHQRRHDRHLQRLGDPDQLGRVDVRGDRAAADVEHRPLGGEHRLGRGDDLLGVAVPRRLVAGDVGLARIGEVEARQLHVLRHVDQHRAGAARAGDVERLLEHLRQVGDVLHEPGVLDDRHRDALDVGLLEGVGADQVRRHLAGDAHDRRRVEVGVGDRRHEVGRAGAGGRDGDAHLAGRTRVALRHVAGALLVAHQEVADRVLVLGPGVVERQDRPARQAEHVGHALGLEAADDRLGAGDAAAIHGPPAWRQKGAPGTRRSPVAWWPSASHTAWPTSQVAYTRPPATWSDVAMPSASTESTAAVIARPMSRRLRP